MNILIISNTCSFFFKKSLNYYKLNTHFFLYFFLIFLSLFSPPCFLIFWTAFPSSSCHFSPLSLSSTSTLFQTFHPYRTPNSTLSPALLQCRCRGTVLDAWDGGWGSPMECSFLPSLSPRCLWNQTCVVVEISLWLSPLKKKKKKEEEED